MTKDRAHHSTFDRSFQHVLGGHAGGLGVASIVAMPRLAPVAAAVSRVAQIGFFGKRISKALERHWLSFRT
jgi:hypothetical protein